MERNGVYYDEDTGDKLVRPSGYNGLLYQKVTNLHKQYLKALGNIDVQKDAKTKLNLYQLTDKDRGYLEGLLSQD